MSNEAFNANWDAIEAAVENTLSRNGTTPNSMGANLDMNSHKILNLPAATDPTDPVRKVDIDALITAAATEITSSEITQPILDAIEAMGDAQTDAVEAAGIAEIALVDAEGTAQVALVTAQGASEQAALNTLTTAKLALIAASTALNMYVSTAAALAVPLAVGTYFTIPGTNGAAMLVYKVTAGPVATYVTSISRTDFASAEAFKLASNRYDTEVGSSLRAYPTQLPLRMYTGTLSGGGTHNADGTYTIPAGGTWTSPDNGVAPWITPGNIYSYVTTTTPVTGAIQITAKHSGTIFAAGSTTTEPQVGVYKQVHNNTTSTDYMTLVVSNVSASAVTIYPIEVYTTDSTYLPQVNRYDDVTSVTENRKIIDWDAISPFRRWGADKVTRGADEKNITVAFDSVAGSDAAAGTSKYAPKQNLTAVSSLSQNDVVGFARNSVFRGKVGGLSTTTQGLYLREYKNGKMFTPFPLFKGAVDATANTWTLESGNCWYTDVTIESGALGTPGYDNIVVMETTTATAATQPLGSTKLLSYKHGAMNSRTLNTKANCISDVGSSYYEQVSGLTYRVWVHPTDGLKPGLGAYTYDVATYYSTMNFLPGGNRSVYVSGVESWLGTNGYGTISGGQRSQFQGVIAAHGGTHTLKMEAGEVKDFIVYNRGSLDGNSANCYMSTDTTGYGWRWTNGAFFECYSPLYSHNGLFTQYASGEMSYLWYIFGRMSDGGLRSDTGNCDYVDKTLEEWCYGKGYQRNGRAGSSGTPVNSTYRYNLGREMGIVNSRKLTENNIIQVENISNPDIPAERNMILCRLTENHVFQNNLVYAKNTTNALVDYRANIFDIQVTGNNNPTAQKNIFIVDTTLSTNGTYIIDEGGAVTWGSDYNVYIFCTPGSIISHKNGGATRSTVADYLTNFTGHDTHSLFMDLRDDPRGAKAIFTDPANGDFTWAQTKEAKQVRDYCLLNGVGPNWTTKAWPTVPTVDEAREILMKAY